MKLETLVIFALTLKSCKVNINLLSLFNARMAELVDAHDSNSCSLECGFDSHSGYFYGKAVIFDSFFLSVLSKPLSFLVKILITMFTSVIRHISFPKCNFSVNNEPSIIFFPSLSVSKNICSRFSSSIIPVSIFSEISP